MPFGGGVAALEGLVDAARCSPSLERNDFLGSRAVDWAWGTDGVCAVGLRGVEEAVAIPVVAGCAVSDFERPCDQTTKEGRAVVCFGLSAPVGEDAVLEALRDCKEIVADCRVASCCEALFASRSVAPSASSESPWGQASFVNIWCWIFGGFFF